MTSEQLGRNTRFAVLFYGPVCTCSQCGQGNSPHFHGDFTDGRGYDSGTCSVELMRNLSESTEHLWAATCELWDAGAECKVASSGKYQWDYLPEASWVQHEHAGICTLLALAAKRALDAGAKGEA